MSNFTVEEMNLICIYNPGTRTGLIDELSEMQNHLEQDETELMELVQSVINKIATMSDGEFESITARLIAVLRNNFC